MRGEQQCNQGDREKGGLGIQDFGDHALPERAFDLRFGVRGRRLQVPRSQCLYAEVDEIGRAQVLGPPLLKFHAFLPSQGMTVFPALGDVS
jgi:hypothetical protein